LAKVSAAKEYILEIISWMFYTVPTSFSITCLLLRLLLEAKFKLSMRDLSDAIIPNLHSSLAFFRTRWKLSNNKVTSEPIVISKGLIAKWRQK
jgi:hypothetical protein